MLWGKKKPIRYPYYSIKDPFLFGSPKWEEHYGEDGCFPVRTEQVVLLEKSPRGIAPSPPTPPKLTREQKKAQKAEEEERKAKEALEKWKQQNAAKAAAEQKIEDTPTPVGIDVERKLPPFDLRDLPKTMKKVGYPVTSQLLEKWFKGSAYAIPNSEQKKKREWEMGLIRVEDELVTLDWALKFGEMKEVLKDLLTEGMRENTVADTKNLPKPLWVKRSVYHKDAMAIAKKKIEEKIKTDFEEDRIFNFSFSTRLDALDFRTFEQKWQFQRIEVKATKTVKGYTTVPTDLTLAVGNCALYAAVGIVVVTGERYWDYDNSKGLKRRCFEPIAEMTHVFVYLKDDFEVNPKDKEVRSQYLGHWNLDGVIISELAFISDLNRKGTSEPFRNYPIWGVKGTPMPVYTGKDTQALQDKALYYPIYNETFDAWRQKWRHGQDFITVTKPEFFKLDKPMVFKLTKLCSPWERM